MRDFLEGYWELGDGKKVRKIKEKQECYRASGSAEVWETFFIIKCPAGHLIPPDTWEKIRGKNAGDQTG